MHHILPLPFLQLASSICNLLHWVQVCQPSVWKFCPAPWRSQPWVFCPQTLSRNNPCRCSNRIIIENEQNYVAEYKRSLFPDFMLRGWQLCRVGCKIWIRKVSAKVLFALSRTSRVNWLSSIGAYTMCKWPTSSVNDDGIMIGVGVWTSISAELNGCFLVSIWCFKLTVVDLVSVVRVCVLNDWPKGRYHLGFSSDCASAFPRPGKLTWQVG